MTAYAILLAVELAVAGLAAFLAIIPDEDDELRRLAPRDHGERASGVSVPFHHGRVE